MNYGFAIDTRRCIGCHACSVACKSENAVPLGVARTWVKSVEVGTFPDVTRHFQVTRCNHCANPPCVRVCPVAAMVQRDDGIVEFDGDVCIGCKACLQACPYDAIYIDPETRTAAKCHFCAHRVEVGLEPSCVVVCPTHAILAGDLDDPESEISRFLGRHPVTVRKPEQGTSPKTFYRDAHDAALHPGGAAEPPVMAFAEARPRAVEPLPAYATAGEVRLHLPSVEETVRRPVGRSSWGTPIRVPDTQGVPAGGPIQVAPGRVAGQMAQVSWNQGHRVPWHWQVPAYLVTKGIGAGTFLLYAAGVLSGRWSPEPGTGAGVATVGLAALLATTALLVADLERPERFLRILLRPQWKSWLTRGAFLLVGFSNLVGLWWLLEVAGWRGWIGTDTLDGARLPLAVLALPLGVGTAVYTAWLFAQCEGRDLWQSTALPIHLLLQAVLAGSATLLALGPLFGATLPAGVLRGILAGALLLDLFVIFAGELGVAHPSELAARAAHAILHGRHARTFWGLVVGLGHALPLALLAMGGGAAAAAAGLAALVGLAAWEHVFVASPQELPNS